MTAAFFCGIAKAELLYNCTMSCTYSLLVSLFISPYEKDDSESREFKKKQTNPQMRIHTDAIPALQ